MDRDLGFHPFHGIFIFVESCETRPTNHCSYWPCMEISCLNRTLCSNGIRSEPLVCLLRATEGHRDKQWWEPDASTVNQEAFPGTLLTVHRSLKPKWEQQMELVLVWRHCYPLQFFAKFFFFARFVNAHVGRPSRRGTDLETGDTERAALYSGCALGNCDLS